MPVNRKVRSRVGVLAAGILVSLPLLGATPAAQADTDAPAVTRAGECVLSTESASGLECGPGLARGPRAVSLWQHPFYEGWRLNIYLPDNKNNCTSPRDDERAFNIKHGAKTDNRVSSVKTYNKCDVKLYDGHRLNGHKRGATGWIEHCDRLSLKSGSCKYWTSPKKRFDNVTSSFRIS